jgi:MFS family permease
MSNPGVQRARSSNETRILVACGAAYCIANIGWWVQPAIVNEVIARFQVGEIRAGLIASAEMTAIAIGSVSFARLLQRFSLRRIAFVGIVIALLGAAWSSVAQLYDALLISRAVVGLGEGAALAVATAGIANFRDPDRAYGKINVAAILFGSLSFLLLGATASIFGQSHNVFPTILGGMALLYPLLWLVPSYVLKLTSDANRRRSRVASPTGALAALAVAVFIVGVTSGAMWSFYFILGTRAGLADGAINTTVTASVLLSVLGAGLATLIGAKFGRFLPVTFGILALTIAIASISLWHNPLVFTAGACLNVAGMYFLVPYFFAYAAAQDPSGRNAAIIGGVFLLTGAAGPYFGGYIIQEFDVSSMAPIVIVANAVAWLLFVAVRRLQDSRGSLVNESTIDPRSA